MNDELRRQLEQLDPMHPGVSVESSTTPSSRTRLEHIMHTPTITHDTSDRQLVPGDQRHRRRTSMILGGVAAAALFVVGGAVLVTSLGGDDTEDVVAGPPLELSLGDGALLASCLPFDVNVLADMSPAFGGTATSVDGEIVTLTVDRWYTGGDAATVVLKASPGMEALIDGFNIEVGDQYLITASQGTVNFCGFSGPATPELTAAFETAFQS